ncbi:MAG: hypothetical protein OEL20_05625 [Sulfuritalea sp.]|nr:hypothetical protein [Sulfuritalea sp.]
MASERKNTERKHARLYAEVQESFVANLIRARRVAGGVDVKTGDIQQMQKSQLASESELSNGTVTKLTSAADTQDAKPDLETLCKLGYALNVSPAFLLMTPRDWNLLLQAFGTIQNLTDSNGEDERYLVQVLEEATDSQNVNESVKSGLKFVEQMHREPYSTLDRARQQMGILAMTAMAQGSVKLQGAASRKYATAIGAILGDREVNSKPIPDFFGETQ